MRTIRDEVIANSKVKLLGTSTGSEMPGLSLETRHYRATHYIEALFIINEMHDYLRTLYETLTFIDDNGGNLDDVLSTGNFYAIEKFLKKYSGGDKTK